MKKEELNKLKSGLKLNSKNPSRIIKGFNIYCKRDVTKMKKIGKADIYFEYEDEEVKEILLENSKKILTGTIGSKIFDLEINNDAEGLEFLKYLSEGLNEDEFDVVVEDFIDDLISEINYEGDVVITTLLVETYFKHPETKELLSHKHINFTVNPIVVSKKEINLSLPFKNLSTNRTNMVIDFKNPQEGFIFPSIENYKPNVNKILYYTGKTNNLNEKFIKNVLNSKVPLTAAQEKNIFNTVLKETVGESIPLSTISNVINDIANQKISNEDGTISLKKFGKILEENGIKNAEESLKDVVSDTNSEVKIDNLIPTKKKGIKLNNSKLTISVDGNSIKNVSKIDKGGKKCLIIELDDDVMLDDFKIV